MKEYIVRTNDEIPLEEKYSFTLKEGKEVRLDAIERPIRGAEDERATLDSGGNLEVAFTVPESPTGTEQKTEMHYRMFPETKISHTKDEQQEAQQEEDPKEIIKKSDNTTDLQNQVFLNEDNIDDNVTQESVPETHEAITQDVGIGFLEPTKTANAPTNRGGDGSTTEEFIPLPSEEDSPIAENPPPEEDPPVQAAIAVDPPLDTGTVTAATATNADPDQEFTDIASSGDNSYIGGTGNDTLYYNYSTFRTPSETDTFDAGDGTEDAIILFTLNDNLVSDPNIPSDGFGFGITFDPGFNDYTLENENNELTANSGSLNGTIEIFDNQIDFSGVERIEWLIGTPSDGDEFPGG